MPSPYRRALLALSTPAAIALLAVTVGFTLTSTSSALPGDLYASDLTTNSLVIYSRDGSVRTFASGLDQPQGIALDADANVYVAESGTGNILKFTPGGTRSIFSKGLLNPIGLAFAGLDLLVSEKDGDVVTRIAPDGTKTVFRSVAAPTGLAFKAGNAYIAHGTSVLSVAASGTATEIDLSDPTRDVAVVSVLLNGNVVNNVFVTADSGTVYKVLPSGTVTTFASGLTDPNGMAFRPARFSGDVDGVGNLYVAETSQGDILEFAKGGVLRRRLHRRDIRISWRSRGA